MLVEKLKKEETFKEWEFSSVIENTTIIKNTKEKISCLYIISREIKGVAKAKIYLDQEIGEKNLSKFGIACLVINPLNRELEKDPDKQHFYDIEKFEKYILDKGKNINTKYFTELPNQEHNAPTQQSSS